MEVREKAEIEVGSHYRAKECSDLDPATYRVVGTENDSVTLLKVTDSNGNRRHTGELSTVNFDELEDGFEETDNPDSGFNIVSSINGIIDGIIWEIRSLLP